MLATALAVVLGTFSSDARLLEAEDLEVFAQTAPPLMGSDVPITDTDDQRAARQRLEAVRAQPEPTLVGPIAVLASGVGSAVAGVLFLYLGFVVGITSLPFIGSGAMTGVAAAWVFLIIGVVGVAVAIPLIIAGARWLAVTLRQRKERTLKIRELERLERQVPLEVPLPPASVMAPQPSLLLATF
ncbi:MAG: hypothetical protein QM817_05370 [Archangium sp.]